jgi:CheY-like chemotaxis protein
MQPKKILIVDDSKVAAMTQQLILRSLRGCEVITAEDGIKGVEKAVAEQPDLILMDVVMPRMNGFEACRLIRGHEATESIPIIMVTTRSEAVHVDEGFASGCSDYILKPIDAAELLEKIQKLADDRQQ